MRLVQMLSKTNINNTYSKWFENIIHDYINPDGFKDVSTPDYLRKNGFFITIGFDRDRVAARKRSDDYINRQRGSVEFDNFNHFYNLVCRRLQGRRYADAKLHSSRPLVIACADAPYSRYWVGSMGEIESLHLHTLWVLRPQHAFGLREAIKSIQSSREYNIFDFDQIDVRDVDRFEEKSGPTAKLTSYMSKFMAWNSFEAAVSEDLRIYPRAIQ